MKQHKKTTHKKSTGFIIAAAAACTALTGVTAAAVTGKLDLLRDVLSQTELRNGPLVPAALLDDAAEGETPQNLTEPETIFAGDESLQITAVSMNYDSNTLMLTLALTPQNGTVIPEDALFVPYFEHITEDGIQRLDSHSGICAVEHLVTDAAADAAYLTYYLAQPEIAGSTLRVTLQNAYSQQQINAVFQGIHAAQEQWHIDYGADSMSAEEWKALWQAEDLDSRTCETEATLLAESDNLLCGTWTADLEIPESDSAPLTAEADGFRVTADTLSLRAEYEETSAAEIFLITFRDGTVLCGRPGTNEERYLRENGVIDENTVYASYTCGMENGYVLCYDAPRLVADIAEIEVYLFDYVIDSDTESHMTVEQHTIYSAS